MTRMSKKGSLDFVIRKSYLCPLYWCARAAITKQHKLGGLNNINVLSPSSGGMVTGHTAECQ